MSQQIPTTKEIAELTLADIEGKINQTTPALPVAYNRVMSATEAFAFTTLYKFAQDRALQNLAISANFLGLQNFGKEKSLPYNAGEGTVLKITIPAEDGIIIPGTAKFTGVLNNQLYIPDGGAIAADGEAILTVTAEQTGIIGNLGVGAELTMAPPIIGAGNTATVTEILNLGLEPESVDEYRQRILFALRANPGGGNGTDYKLWAEGVAGVARAYVYAGRPFDVIETSYPGDRTLYIEAISAVDPDGIAPPSLLAEVREAVNLDPETAEARPPLGLIDSTLYVESIVRTPFYIEIRNYFIPEQSEVEVKARIEDIATSYFFGIKPFVAGIDFPPDRNDRITALAVSELVQGALAAKGGYAEEVVFGPAADIFIPLKTLEPNELAKVGGIAYVG